MPYICHICGSSHSTNSNMHKHIRKIHGVLSGMSHKICSSDEKLNEPENKILPNLNVKKFQIKMKNQSVKINSESIIHNVPITNNGLVTNNNGSISVVNNINTGPVINITNNITANILIKPKDYNFNGCDLHELICKSSNEKDAYDYLMYNLQPNNISEIIVKFMIDPPDGTSPLDLIDTDTIGIRIDENKVFHDTDGQELEKRTRQMLSGACVIANKRINDLIADLTKKKQEYADLAYNCKDPVQQLEYENKCEELHKDIFEGSANKMNMYQIYDRVDMAQKFKLNNKCRKNIRNLIGQKCIKLGKIVPGMKISMD